MAAVGEQRELALGANQFSCRGGRGAGSGYDVAAIDTVAFTHLDGDHTGWAFSQEQDGTYRKTFPAARYLIAGQATPNRAWPQSRSARPPASLGTRLPGRAIE
jgi:hypothetical protein